MTPGDHANRFNLSAQNYSTDRYPARGECMQTVLRLLDPGRDDIVLDVGCGPGAQLIALAPQIRGGFGIDIARAMIERASAQAAASCNLRFLVGTAERLPRVLFAAGINKVMSNYALHHLPDTAKEESIRTLAQLLPSGGKVVLGDLMFSDDPARHRKLFDVVGYGPGSDTPATVAALQEMFSSAGLRHTTHVLNPLVGVIVGRK